MLTSGSCLKLKGDGGCHFRRHEYDGSWSNERASISAGDTLRRLYRTTRSGFTGKKRAEGGLHAKCTWMAKSKLKHYYIHAYTDISPNKDG
jgi:hypothetical protein